MSFFGIFLSIVGIILAYGSVIIYSQGYIILPLILIISDIFLLRYLFKNFEELKKL
jgi:hypothetical protein